MKKNLYGMSYAILTFRADLEVFVKIIQILFSQIFGNRRQAKPYSELAKRLGIFLLLFFQTSISYLTLLISDKDFFSSACINYIPVSLLGNTEPASSLLSSCSN